MSTLHGDGISGNSKGKELRQGRLLDVLGHRRNKRIKTTTREDFASGYEFRVWTDAKRRGLRIEYEPLTFDYERRIAGGRCQGCGSSVVVKRARYTPDFRVGGRFLIETKGKFDSASRSRMDDFVRSRPNVKVAMLFGADNWTTKARKQRYTDWCEQRGITCAVGDSIPEGWVTNENATS